MLRRPPTSTLFPYTTLFLSKSTRLNSSHGSISYAVFCLRDATVTGVQTCALDRKRTRLTSSHGTISYAVFCSRDASLTGVQTCALDRKSTRLNSSHGSISYAVFCLKKKKQQPQTSPYTYLRQRSSPSREMEARSRTRGGQQIGCSRFFFFFNDTATTEIYTLSLHDALPIFRRVLRMRSKSGLRNWFHSVQMTRAS